MKFSYLDKEVLWCCALFLLLLVMASVCLAFVLQVVVVFAVIPLPSAGGAAIYQVVIRVTFFFHTSLFILTKLFYIFLLLT
jgi:hypothetical protein